MAAMQRLLPVANVRFMEAQLQHFSEQPAVIRDGRQRALSGLSKTGSSSPLDAACTKGWVKLTVWGVPEY